MTGKADALSRIDAPQRATPARNRRVMLVQTQAEGAGAQEITRILGHGLTARGYEVHHVFFFRRTGAFDQQPNTHFCAPERPADLRSLFGMVRNLLRHMRAVRPGAVLTFQHYGNLLGTVAARLTGGRAVIANRVSARALEPAWTRALDFVFGLTGLFDRVVVNSQAVADEYASHPPRYRDRLVRIDHGFEPKRSDASAVAARRSLNLPLDVPLMGSVARLHETKNLSAAIRLLKLHPDWHLALAGQGPERVRLEALAAIARRCRTGSLHRRAQPGAGGAVPQESRRVRLPDIGGNFRSRGGRSRAGGRPGRRQRPRSPARGAACG